MAHGELATVDSSMVVRSVGVPLVHSVDPWLIVGLAARYQQDYAMFEKSNMATMADQADYMLTAMQEIAGLALHGDKTYFTWGPGNEEYLRNCGDEA